MRYIIKNNFSEMKKSVVRNLITDLNKQFKKVARLSVNKIINLTRIHLKNSETYKALTQPGGLLAGHFGLPIGTEKGVVDEIVDYISGRIELKVATFQQENDQLIGGMDIILNKSVLTYLTQRHGSFVVTEKGQTIPWLDWLLFAGDEIILTGFRIKFKAAGRSGQAIMIPQGYWRVPPAYSGTEGNNWITEELGNNDGYLKELTDTIINDLI